MNLMLIVFLVGSICSFFLQLFLELIQALQLSMWPTLDAMFSALLFQGSYADAQGYSSRINRKMKVL